MGTAKTIDLKLIFTAKSADDPMTAGASSTIRQPSALTFDQERIVGLKLWARAMSAFDLPQHTTPGETLPQTVLLSLTD